MSKETIKLVISYINPPIPHRDFDWCVYIDGREEEGNYGYGKTAVEALKDFISNMEDEEDNA